MNIKKLKRYCKKCGAKLKYQGKKVYIYNPMTGEPEYEYFFKCPKTTIFFLKHDCITFLNRRNMNIKKLEKLEKWLEDYLPDFWEIKGKQFQYGWEYLKNDILLAIKQLKEEK